MRYYSPTGFAILCVVSAGRVYRVLSSKKYRAVSSLIIIILLIGGLYGAGIIGRGKVEARPVYGNSTNGTLDGVETYYFDNSKEIVYFKVDGGYTIQVGSFIQQEKAYTCADEKKILLDRKRIIESNNNARQDIRQDIRIEEIINSNGLFYRVRVGKFATLDDAKDFSKQLASN